MVYAEEVVTPTNPTKTPVKTRTRTRMFLVEMLLTQATVVMTTSLEILVKRLLKKKKTQTMKSLSQLCHQGC